ncbi:alkaline phosphatase, partial [Micromonospora sp. NPDC057140]
MTSLDRRTLLRAGLATGAGLAGGALFGAAGAQATGAQAAPPAGAPAWRPSGRPVLTHGVQSGDVTADSALEWTR